MSNLVLAVLQDALRDPHQVADLLLLELDEGVEDAQVHLRLEGQLQQLDLVLVKLVVYGEIVCGVEAKGQVSNKSKSKEERRRGGTERGGQGQRTHQETSS